MTHKDPRSIIGNGPMGAFQIVAVAICVLLNALDGFDVLAITFAVPGISEEWALGSGVQGIIISTGLAGMVVGSLALGPLADVVGRRAIIMCCLLTMTLGMALSATAQGIYSLAAYRVITGVGLGGMLASINAMAAEWANNRHRNLCVSLMTVGYPVGGVLGGLAVAQLLQHYDWRSVFVFGMAASAVVVPLVLWRLPESIEFLATRRGPNALEKVNQILTRMGRATVTELPLPQSGVPQGNIFDIFRPELASRTIAVCSGYFLHILTFYYVLGWIPSIVAALGFPHSVAAGVSVSANLGGILSGLIFGYAARFVGLKLLAAIAMIGGAGMLIVFGRMPANLPELKAVAFVLGIFVFGGMVCLYAILARIYPAHVRSTGTGLSIGVGRFGAVLGPTLGGWLMMAGLARPTIAAVMGIGSVLAAIAILNLQSSLVAAPDRRE